MQGDVLKIPYNVEGMQRAGFVANSLPTVIAFASEL